ncbi:MAG: response regulator transcription factor [Ferruginibacter sp.]
MKKFLLIDDHIVVRSGIKILLQQSFEAAEVYEAANGESAMEEFEKRSYDLVMLDIQMPKTDSLQLLQNILKLYPQSKVLVFSMSSENVHAKRFLKAGARGFISKESPLEEILRAVTQILDNRRYISDALASVLANESFDSRSDNPFSKLSAREFEIASLLLAGQTISSISASIKIQVSTVGTHKARMFEKLGVTNLLELKEMANAHNL